MDNYDPSRRILAIGITALAGFVDAAGFLAGDRYFVSFMSGNTTRLAVDLVTDLAQALIPLGLIGGFVIGVTGRRHRIRSGRTNRAGRPVSTRCNNASGARRLARRCLPKRLRSCGYMMRW